MSLAIIIILIIDRATSYFIIIIYIIIQSASYVNLGHAIQIINQNDPAPPRIPHPSSPTTPVVTPTIATPTVPTVVISVQTDGTSSSLKLSRFTGWITILVLALFAPLAF